MTDIKVFETSSSRPAQLPAAIEIHDGPAPARGNAGSSGGHGESMGGSPSRNGRAPWPLPKISLEEVWKHPFDPPWNVRGLMAAGGSVYAAGQSRWVLMEAAGGTSRAGGLRGIGEAALDPENQLLFQPGGDGQLEGLFLERGQPVFWTPLHLGSTIDRPFAARVGDSLVLVGREQPIQGSESLEVPKWTTVEALPIWPQPEVRESRQLQPGTIAPRLFERRAHQVAAWSSGLVLAFSGHLFVLDDTLAITAHLTGNFTPLALSVDESGVAHLIIEDPDFAKKPAELDDDGNLKLAPRELWIVGKDGVRSLRMVLPIPFDRAGNPPLLTSTRDLILRGPKGYLCLSPSGAIRWSRPLATSTGAIVTGDNQLLSAEGPELVAYDGEGQRTVVKRFDAPLTCAPVIEEGGFITAATANCVYRLRPNPRAR